VLACERQYIFVLRPFVEWIMRSHLHVMSRVSLRRSCKAWILD